MTSEILNSSDQELFGSYAEDYVILAACLAVSIDGIVNGREQHIVTLVLEQMLDVDETVLAQRISLSLEMVLLHDSDDLLNIFFKVKDQNIKRKCLVSAAESCLTPGCNKKLCRKYLKDISTTMGVQEDDLQTVIRYVGWKYSS
jgi:hypothetical protein